MNQNSNSTLTRYLLSVAVGIIILTLSAWGAWVTNTINKHTDILSDIHASLARIEQSLSDHFIQDTKHGRN